MVFNVRTSRLPPRVRDPPTWPILLGLKSSDGIVVAPLIVPWASSLRTCRWCAWCTRPGAVYYLATRGGTTQAGFEEYIPDKLECLQVR